MTDTEILNMMESGSISELCRQKNLSGEAVGWRVWFTTHAGGLPFQTSYVDGRTLRSALLKAVPHLVGDKLSP